MPVDIVFMAYGCAFCLSEFNEGSEMTTEVVSFVGELVRVNEKLDAFDVRDRLGGGCESVVVIDPVRGCNLPLLTR